MAADPQHLPATSRGRAGDAERPQRLDVLHAQLSAQVLQLTTGPAWTQWLQTAAKFHRYSFNNTHVDCLM